ncbi:MAG: CDP-diacylglycerol--glycerol-3-phosphate 3-phosphatidyltransferase [Alphaproteobacteria bacterium]
MTVPNQLTIARMVAVPALIGAFYLAQPYAAFACFALFVAASLTDFLDGYLARKLNQPSELGRVLDPIADKLIVAAALVMLVAFDGASPIAAAAILCRELLISGLREALAGRVVLKVTWLAKAKTAVQMIAIAVLLIAPALGIAEVTLAGEAALWLAVLLSWASAAGYLRIAFGALVGSGKSGAE